MLDTKVIDSTLFVFTVLASLAYWYFRLRQPSFSLKDGLAFGLVFLTLYPFLNMVVHLVVVTIFAVLKAKVGAFNYDLRFYCLIQFGVLLAGINLYLFTGVTNLCRGSQIPFYRISYPAILQILIALPLVPFNPISFLPVITSVMVMIMGYLGYYRSAAPAVLHTKISTGGRSAKQMA